MAETRSTPPPAAVRAGTTLLADAVEQVVDTTPYRLDVPASLLRLLDGPMAWVAAYTYMHDPWNVTVDVLPHWAVEALSEVAPEDGGPTAAGFGVLVAMLVGTAARTHATVTSYTIQDVFGLCAAARSDLGLGAAYWEQLGRSPGLEALHEEEQQRLPCTRCSGALGHWLHLWARRQARLRLVPADLPAGSDRGAAGPRPKDYGVQRRFLN